MNQSVVQRLQPTYLIVYVPFALLLSSPIRLLIKKFNCVFPPNLFLMLFGVIVGFCMIGIRGEYFVGISHVPPDTMLSVFLPIYIVSIIYRIDFNIFIRCLPQAVLICCVKVLVYLFVMGVLFHFILQPDWTYTMSVLAALVCLPIQPNNIIGMFKELARYKYLGTIIEAEAVLTCVPVFIIFDFELFFFDRIYDRWYTFFPYFVWSLAGGTIVGCLLGKLTSVLMCWIYNEPQGSICVFIGMTFFTYYLCQYTLHVSGPLSIICLVCFVVADKHSFSTEVDMCNDNFWYTMNYMAEVVSIIFIMMELTKYMWYYAVARDIYDIVIIYFCANVSRLLYFQVLGCIINRMAYHINVRCLMVLGWSGVKGSINLMQMLILCYHDTSKEFARHLSVEMLVYVFLTMLINGTSMRYMLQFTGLSELSSTRRTNMNNCMKFLTEKRYSVINILKLNRYLSDANWVNVRSETVMKHPYKIKMLDEDASDDEDDFIWNANSAICPECFKEVPFDISDKELAEMMKEAQIKVLKAKKVSIIKQYETGIINKSSLEVLIHIFEIMIESNQENNLVDLSKYLKEATFLELLGKALLVMDTRKWIEPPETQCNKLCYYLMMHVAYDYILFAFVIMYCCVQGYFFLELQYRDDYVMFLVILNTIFFVDCVIKIMGYNQRRCNGFKRYFHEGWNIFDFLMLLLGLFDLAISLTPSLREVPYLPYIVKGFCMLRGLKIFYIMQPVYPRMVKAIEFRSDDTVSVGYNLATALVNCCDELLELISQIIEVKVIRDTYGKRIQDERLALIKLMDRVQKERPWVAITMKTRQVIRITVTAMEEALNQLKFSGFVDNIEYSFIYKEIFDKQKFLRNMKYVQASPPKMIFNGVSWMEQDNSIINYLYDNVQMTHWDMGDVICRDGQFLRGVLIVVSGLLKLRYFPKETTMDRYYKIGYLPIVDYLSTLNIQDELEDSIMSGNTIGELSILTGRPYDCDIIADSPGRAYVLTTDVMKLAMRISRNPVNGLEARMWRHATFNIAIAVLMESTTYQAFTQEQIKFKLERAFVPNIRCYKMFVNTDMMDDIILIEGIAADFVSGNIFVAPTLIPRSIKKLVLPRSSTFDVDEVSETRLLIIPTGDVKDYEVMEYEEEVAELISIPSSSCLLHKSTGHKSKGALLRRTDKTQAQQRKIVITQSANYSEEVRDGAAEVIPITEFPDTETQKEL